MVSSRSGSPNRVAARYLENITSQANNNNQNVPQLLKSQSKRKIESPLSSPRRSKSVKHGLNDSASNTPIIKQPVQDNVLRSPVEIFADNKQPEELFSRSRLRSTNTKTGELKENKENNVDRDYMNNLTLIQKLQLKFQPEDKPIKFNRPQPLAEKLSTHSEQSRKAESSKQQNLLEELESFGEKRRLNQISLKKTSSVAQGKSPKGNKGYEYLCRIAEIKEWLEGCLKEQLPSALELSRNGFKNGVILAKLTQHFVPELVKRIVPANPRGTVEYRHTENIVHFFYFLDYIDMPDLFRFELTDLYEGKNIPKVIFCLYALCFMLSQQDGAPKLKSLVGKLEFEESDIRSSERKLKDASVPDFGSFEPLMKSLELENGFFQAEKEEDSQEPLVIHHESPIEMYTELKIEMSSLGKIEEQEEPMDISMNNQSMSFIRHSQEEGNDTQVRFTQSTLRRVDSIKKPKFHDFSLVEIEDTTIIQEQATDDMSDNELDSVLKSIIKVQSLGRGFISRYQMFVKKTMLNMFVDEIISLQSLARRKLFMKTKKAQRLRRKRVSAKHIVQLQAIIRGSLYRETLMEQLRALKKEKAAMIQFQAVIRGEISRFYTDSLLLELEEHEPIISELQAISKGHMVRQDYMNKQRILMRTRRQLITLQSVYRGNHFRRSLYNGDNVDGSDIVKLQSIIRGYLYRKKARFLMSDAHGNRLRIINLQAAIRGYLLRNQCKEIYYNMYKARGEILELQMIARGGLARSRLNKMLLGLDYNEAAFDNISAVIRGSLLRRKIAKLKTKLHKHDYTVSLLQATIKGVLTRFKIELLIDDVHEHEAAIERIQAKIKGCIMRRGLHGMMEHYTRNVDKVIKVQSMIKAYNQNDAYRKLIAMKNPTLEVVRQFAYLLNDTSKDVDEEIKLENLNHQIVMKTSENNELEKHCNEMDAKIALLVKNKITLDELIHQKSVKQLDFEFKRKMNKQEGFSHKKSETSRYEAFESLIYILQTCPEYFVRLFGIYHSNYALKEEIEKMALICFDYGGTKKRSEMTCSSQAPPELRNEFLFINLIIHSVQDHLSSTESLEDFKLNPTVVSWQKLLSFFNKSEDQRKQAKKIFGSLISSISEIDNLTLESNPLKIYRNCIIVKEAETGVKSNKPKDVPVEMAIKDPDARDQYIKNLNSLRELTIKVLTTLENSIHMLPLHIRTICCHTYTCARKQFGSEDKALVFALTILVEQYMVPIISCPENYNIPLITFSTKESLSLKVNLGYICKVLVQIASMQEFLLNQVYFQPLNEFVTSSIPSMRRIIKKVIEIGDIESAYNMNSYHDLTSKVKPSLIIKNVELLSLKNFIQEFIRDMAPSKRDPIHEYIKQLDKVKMNISNQDIKDVKLLLNPSIKNFIGVKTNTLLLDAKRCMLYIMQVQSNKTNLLGLLLSKITANDEAKFRDMLQREENTRKTHESQLINENERNEFSRTNFFKNVSSMSFHELKSHTLEIVLELESLGKLSRENRFQSLLNDIAFDIKTKHDQRMARSKEIKLSVQTLESLHEKEKYLKNMLDTYNNYIKKSIATLQETSNNNRKKHLPFSKQYFYQRALKKRGKQSKFGAYKYSSKYLFENKILLAINGITHLELLKVDFNFSCDEIGVFSIELEGGLIEESASAGPILTQRTNELLLTGRGNNNTRNSAARLKLDDLLQYQYEGKPTIEIYNGIVKFDTINLLTFIFKKFYDTHNSSNKHHHNGFGASLGSSIASFGASFGTKK